MRFLDHTQRSNTVRRNPLEEWPARSKDFYLTNHSNTRNRLVHMHSGGIRTQNLNSRGDAEPRLRTSGQRDRTYPNGDLHKYALSYERDLN